VEVVLLSPPSVWWASQGFPAMCENTGVTCCKVSLPSLKVSILTVTYFCLLIFVTIVLVCKLESQLSHFIDGRYWIGPYILLYLIMLLLVTWSLLWFVGCLLISTAGNFYPLNIHFIVVQIVSSLDKYDRIHRSMTGDMWIGLWKKKKHPAREQEKKKERTEVQTKDHTWNCRTHIGEP